jgi:streptomycin 6-kinase
MNDTFVNNILELYGDRGKNWLDGIPHTIEKYQQKWNIEVYPPFILTYNFVAPAKRIDGASVVLKIGFPHDKEFQGEINALEVFNGNGSEKILEADRENAVMLLEHVLPGTPLSNLEDDEKETKIIASVMKKIWKPLSKNHTFVTIFEWTKELREYPNKYGNQPNPPIPMQFVQKAISLFNELINSSSKAVLVHGDLHHDNLLSSDRDSWLAIDPKGIAAEPIYEVAAMMRNPYERIKNSSNLEVLLRNRIAILSSELQFDPERIRKWCYAQTVLSGVWSSDTIEYINHSLKVARALDNFGM